MAGISLVGSKALLAFCNFLLLACGSTLVSGGLLVLFDPERVLLSRLLSYGSLTTLPNPLLYYIGLGLVLLGLILSGTGVLGCWASCIYSCCVLTIYFLLIMIVLVGECAVYTIAWAWPQCLGLGLIPEELAKTVQTSYGVAGQEQFTAAIDLTQTLFNCCGIQTSNEYDTSLWRLQATRPLLAVPLTCCKLENVNSANAYLNPAPVNTSLCQTVDVGLQQGFRHIGGCGEHLEKWYKEQYIMFLGVGLVIVLIEFSVLLCTILACTKLYQHKQTAKDIPKTSSTAENTVRSSSYPDASQRRSPFSIAYTNDAYTMSNSFRQNYKLVEKA